MCGFAGFVDTRDYRKAEKDVLVRMTNTLTHRGPNSEGYFLEESVGLGFRRLSIIDLESGDQPLYNEDHSVVLLCNGEIFNCCELKRELIEKGHAFRTKSDVEVLLHLYEEGGDFLNRLNGQFAFVIYDRTKKTLLLARDHFGINPLYYTLVDGVFCFASELKAILEHPLVHREVDLVGLDQILSYPGLAGGRTMFKGIMSLKGGHYITVKNQAVVPAEYFDLDYPQIGEISYDKPEDYYVEGLRSHLTRAVKHRLLADVPVGFYLSGGLDSSMLGAIATKESPGIKRHSFSVSFRDKQMCESGYQRLMARYVGSIHHEIVFDWADIADRLARVVYHSEHPLKETYNTASFALSNSAKDNDVPVVLNGEGSDELFGGYVGYRFDQYRADKAKKNNKRSSGENESSALSFAASDFVDLFYEKDQRAFRPLKAMLYSGKVNESLGNIDILEHDLINIARLQGRHFIHQRSYLDFKLRLSGHLIADHGDRMAMANSVEGRYPFLDIDLVKFATQIPPDLKLNRFTEKYILKKAAEGIVPPEIIKREKFAFAAPGSPYLLQQNIEWVEDLLSPETIEKQGYFNAEEVNRLKARYSEDGFRLNVPYEDDLLITVLTFGLFLNLFKLPNLN